MKKSIRRTSLSMLIFFFVFSIYGDLFAENSIKMFGFMKDVGGNPVKAYVGINDENWNFIQGVETGTSGYYEISVPRHSAYNFWIDSWVQKGDYQVEAYIPQKKTVELRADQNIIEANFILKPAGNIIVHFYDNNGNLVRNDFFRGIFQANNWVTTLDNLPTDGLLNIALYKECGGDWHNALPAFIVPLNEPVAVHILYEVPGFGKIIVTADNESQGYQVNNRSGYIEINMNYEMAKSKVAALEKDYNDIISQGYNISSDTSNQIERAREYLEEAEGYLSGSSPDMKKVVDTLNNSLREAYYAHEKLYLERADSDIEKYRKGDATLKILDSEGKPVPNCKVGFKEINHDFLFGALPMGEHGGYTQRYADLMEDAGINYSGVTFPWKYIEPSPGVYSWDIVDQYQRIDELIKKGFHLYGGQILWFFRDERMEDIGGDPDWVFPYYLDDLTFDEFKSLTYNHIYQIVDRYKCNIAYYQILHEPNLWNYNIWNSTWKEKLDVYRIGVQAMKDCTSNGKILYTSPALPYEFGVKRLEGLDNPGELASPIDFLNLLLDENIPFDTIGLEFYYAGVIMGNIPLFTLDMTYISNLFDQYSLFKKPIWVQEVSAPSKMVEGSGWWHHVWDDETQAEYLRDFYTIAFSKPLVKAIMWSYGVSDIESYVINGGLLDADLNPKPSYYALKDLITSSWTTSGEGVTDENGQMRFRGFAGDYQIQVEFPDGVRTYSAHVYEQKSVSYKISPSSIIAEPIPDIKANHLDGPLRLNQSGTLAVTISLDNNEITDSADWWLVASTPLGIWFYGPEGWTENWKPVYQGPLFYLDSFELLHVPVSGLPAGTYTFYFGIDTDTDRHITWDSLYFDGVAVNVTE